MGVYEGLSEIRNQGIPIMKGDIHSMRFISRVRKGYPDYENNPCGLVIRINMIYYVKQGYSDLSLEEQVRTLIHEALHISPPFIYDYGINIPLSPKLTMIMEEKIEALQRAVYDNQPVLVDYLLEVLSQSNYVKKLEGINDFVRDRREKLRRQEAGKKFDREKQLKLEFIPI